MAASPDTQGTTGGMDCMEVYGGNGNRDEHLRRPGLDIWLWTQCGGGADPGGRDVHLLSSCASGRITRMLLADVCGRGQSLTEVSMGLRDLMKGHVNSIRQTRMVRSIARKLEDVSHRGAYASMLLSTYFAPTGSFRLCNGGHPPPFVFRRATGQWSVLRSADAAPTHVSSPLGVVDQTEYQHVQTTLAQGDMILSYSNVWPECRTDEGRTLGLSGFLELVSDLDEDEPGGFLPKLRERVNRNHAVGGNDADATLMLCYANDRKVSWRDNLLAPFRFFFRPISDRTSFL